MGERIDRFTEDMLPSAMDIWTWNSTCLCAMWIRPRCERLPLRDNTITVIPGLPPVSQVNGRRPRSAEGCRCAGRSPAGAWWSRCVFRSERGRTRRRRDGRHSERQGGPTDIRHAAIQSVAGMTPGRAKSRYVRKICRLRHRVRPCRRLVQSPGAIPTKTPAASRIANREEHPGWRRSIRVQQAKVLEPSSNAAQRGIAWSWDRGVVAGGRTVAKLPTKGIVVAALNRKSTSMPGDGCLMVGRVLQRPPGSCSPGGNPGQDPPPSPPGSGTCTT